MHSGRGAVKVVVKWRRVGSAVEAEVCPSSVTKTSLPPTVGTEIKVVGDLRTKLLLRFETLLSGERPQVFGGGVVEGVPHHFVSGFLCEHESAVHQIKIIIVISSNSITD